MAWLQRPAAKHTASVSNHGNEADPDLRQNSVPMEPNNSEGYEPDDSSSHSREDTCLLPYSGTTPLLPEPRECTAKTNILTWTLFPSLETKHLGSREN